MYSRWRATSRSITHSDQARQDGGFRSGAVNKLKEALGKSEKPERKQQAAGWKSIQVDTDGAG